MKTNKLFITQKIHYTKQTVLYVNNFTFNYFLECKGFKPQIRHSLTFNTEYNFAANMFY